MNIIQGKRIKLVQLSPTEEFPKDLVTKEHSNFLAEQNGQLYWVQNSPLHSILSEFKTKDRREYMEKTFGKSPYSPNYVYILAKQWDEFKIPKETFAYVKRYFQKIYDVHGTEAAVILMVNMTKKDWQILYVPQVHSSGGGVNYLMPKDNIVGVPDKTKRYYEEVFKDKKASELMAKSFEDFNRLSNEGYVVYGTIHSHCNFAAFHSGTDDNDETNFPGLHITIGNVRSGWSYSQRYMLATAAHKIDDLTTVVDMTQEELKADVSNIEIDDYHFSLMMPKLGEPKNYGKFVSWGGPRQHGHGNGKAKRKDRGRVHNLWQKDDSSDSRWPINHYIPDNEQGYRVLDEDLDDEYQKNVIEADDIIQIFDLKEGKILCVMHRYYVHNKMDKFPPNRFVAMDDPIPTEDMMKQHAQYEDEEEEDISEPTTELILFDDPYLNPNFPSTYSIQLAEEIDPKALAGKANKKE